MPTITNLPEVTITAPRQYVKGYDKNGNPVYTTDPTKSMGYNAPILQSHEDIQKALIEKPNTGKQWADLATKGIGLALAPIAAAPVVEAGLPIMNAMARPLTTTAKVGSRVFPTLSKTLPYTEMADRGIMGYSGAKEMQESVKKWYNEEIPWYQAVPQIGLSGLMMADSAPLVKSAGKLADAATRKNLWNEAMAFFNETIPQAAKREYANFKRHVINSKTYEDRLRDLQDRIYDHYHDILYIPSIKSGMDQKDPYIRAAANKALLEISKLDKAEDTWIKIKEQNPTPSFINSKTPTESKAPDFSKMSTENVEKWLDKHVPFASVKEPLMRDWNNVTKRFEHEKGVNFDPNRAVTTGKIQLIDAATGQPKTFNLDRIPNENSTGTLEVFPIKIGDMYRVGTETSTKTIDSARAFFPEAPRDYLEAVGKNIDYITNEAVSGSKVFGSSANVRAGNLYHDAHDIDVIMPYKEAVKHKEFSNWTEIRRGATYTYRHPTAGDIDVNVIMEDSEGNATGKLAHELYAQMYPKQYANIMKKAISKGITPSTDLPLDKTADELFKAFDPVQKSIIDTFASSKDKHMKRAYYLLNYGKLNDVRKGFDGYMGYLTGGEWEPTKVALSEFDNPSVNSKLIDQLGLKGINKGLFINSPERMKLLFDYSIYENTFVGRGVDSSGKNAQDIIKSATFWYPDTYGGTAKGVGLNTVLGGNSGYGDTYFSIMPNRMKRPSSTTIEGVLEGVEHNLGNIHLTSEDIKNLRSVARNLQIPEKIIRDNTTLSLILEKTAGKNGQNYKDFINWIARKYDIPLITNGMYGQSKYASLLEDLPFDNVVQVFPHGIDRPVSLKAREGSVIDNRPSNEYSILEFSANTAPKNTGRYIDDTPQDMFTTLMLSKKKRVYSKFLNTVQKAQDISKTQEERVSNLLKEHWNYVRKFDNMVEHATAGAVSGGFASGMYYAGTIVHKKREERRKKIGTSDTQRSKKDLRFPIKPKQSKQKR